MHKCIENIKHTCVHQLVFQCCIVQSHPLFCLTFQTAYFSGEQNQIQGGQVSHQRSDSQVSKEVEVQTHSS